MRSTATAHLRDSDVASSVLWSPGLALVEEQDIIHMEPIGGGTEKVGSPCEARPAPTWQRTITPDALTLFRFSALTFNSHRIPLRRAVCEVASKSFRGWWCKAS